MALAGNYGTRASTNSPPAPTSQNDDEPSKNPIHQIPSIFSWPFSIPSTPESAAVRIIKNLEKFSLYYAIFIWTVLFITVVPKRKVSIIYLITKTVALFLYFLLFRAFPVLQKIANKRFGYFYLLFVKPGLELIPTSARTHLFATLAATVPIVLLHAVLVKKEDLVVNEEEGEMVRLVQEKLICDVQNLV